MTAPFDMIVHDGRCVLPWGVVEADIGIRNGLIAAIGDLSQAVAERRWNARNLHVLPGIIDSQVHFREPGLEHKEDLATGTAAAALGGVTTVLEMPNTSPATTTREAMADKVQRVEGRTHADVGFFLGAARENATELATLERLPGCAGVKVFMGSSTGTLLVEDDPLLATVLAHGTRRVAIHAEDEARLRERRPMVDAPGATAHLHPHWRDDASALRATTRLLALSRQTGRRVHVLHVTTAEEMTLLAQHKELATVEVTPQHLTLAAPDCYERLGTYAQMNPPIRDERHRAALWAAVASGVVDVVGSDHAPHTRAEKDRPYPASPSGLPGVQTMLPLMLNHVAAGRLSLTRLVELLCTGPSRIYGLARKGRLVVGYHADLTLVDLQRRETIDHARMASRCGWTPFHGMEITGWPVATLLRGEASMQEGQLVGTPRGQIVRFEETAAG